MKNKNENIDWEAPKSALEKWDSSISAKKHLPEDRNVINILETIGEDFFGEGVTAKSVQASLKDMGPKAEVTVNINSPGGSMFEGLTIFNALKEHKGKVNVKILGIAASAASLIAMAGDHVEISESGFIMIHNAWGVIIGNKNDMRTAADMFDKFDESQAIILSKNSDLTRAEVRSFMDEETFFLGEEAVEAGFADSLLPSDEVEKSDSKAKSVLTIIDEALAKDGISRSKRRTMFKELTSTPSAADSITPSADDLCTALQGLLTVLTPKKELNHA